MKFAVSLNFILMEAMCLFVCNAFVLKVQSPTHLFPATIANNEIETSTIRSSRMDPQYLPVLSPREHMRLIQGERIQAQSRMGREGFGWVVVDVNAPPDVVFDRLTDFSSYDKMIPTVRNVNILKKDDKSLSTSVEFSLSKFRLKVNVIKTVNFNEKSIHFKLDSSRPNLALRKAEGFWLVQTPEERPEGYSRVWLYAGIVASRLLPTMIVDYAAGRAFPRATTWLQPYFKSLPVGADSNTQLADKVNK